jgi:hypothetical protein
MERMDDEDLITELQRDIDDAEELTDVVIGPERERVFNAYLRRPDGKERTGRSSVMSSDVFKTVEGISTAIANIFLEDKNPVEFQARAAEKAKQAEQRTAVVNYIFNVQNDGIIPMLESIKDGIQLKCGALTWYWKVDRRVTEAEYENQTQMSIMAMTNDDPDMQIVSVEQTGEEDQPSQDEMGQPITIKSPVYKVLTRKIHESGGVCVESIAPEDLLITSGARSCRIKDAPVVIVRWYATAQELIREGYDEELVETLDFVSTRSNNGGTTAPLRRQVDDLATGTGGDQSGEALIYRMFKTVDYDGDGIPELRCIYLSGDTILKNKIVDEIPISTWGPTIQPHEFFSRCPGDESVQTQDVNTALTRQTLDNLYMVNNPMWLLDKKDTRVNPNDFINPSIGKVLSGHKDAVSAVTFPFVAQHSYQMMEYFESDNENKTGFTRYSQGLDSKSLNQTATGVNIITNMSQQKVKMMARLYGQMCLAPAMRGIAKLISQKGEKPLAIRLSGEYVEVDPREWNDEFDMVVNVGLGVVDKQERRQDLMAVIGDQNAIVQGGGLNTIVSPQNIYNLRKEAMDVIKIGDASKFYTDPSTLPPPDPNAPKPPTPEQVKAQADMQLAQMKIQSEKEIAQLRLQGEQMIAQMKAQFEAQKFEQEMQLKREQAQNEYQLQSSNDQRQAELDERKAMLDANTKVSVERARSQAKVVMPELGETGENEALTPILEMLAQNQAMLQQTLAAMVAAQGAPKRLVRDAQGRAVGVETVQ